ncbi:thioredoxin domain-containing protein [Aureimonas psammosilenae]|uniref:hypothetical protein n=1 Tax=Aureimonas psammosilenae TaxID=2495496 RepID=UPI001260F2D0|nr:hypothetical protein [Aureimonas psammosilenae]
MMRSGLLALALLVASPAIAALGPGTLNAVSLEPAPGARLSLDARLSENGRNTTLGSLLRQYPASLLVFADYTCKSVCGAELSIAAASLASPELADVNAGLLVVGLDPKDDAGDAARMRGETLGGTSPDLQAKAHFLQSDAATIAQLTSEAGYGYRYDAAEDQFAHPAALLVLRSDGQVGRALAGLSLMPETLRRALVETGDGRIGTLLERVALRCYAFDPATGLYTADIKAILRIAALGTVLALAGLVLLLLRRRPHAGAAR